MNPHMPWSDDRDFVVAAQLLWPEDVRLAGQDRRAKGRVVAARTMQHRYGGWCLLVSLGNLEEEARRAAKQLRVLRGVS